MMNRQLKKIPEVLGCNEPDHMATDAARHAEKRTHRLGEHSVVIDVAAPAQRKAATVAHERTINLDFVDGKLLYVG